MKRNNYFSKVCGIRFNFGKLAGIMVCVTVFVKNAKMCGAEGGCKNN